jgi:hypothetical protein
MFESWDGETRAAGLVAAHVWHAVRDHVCAGAVCER